MRSLKLSKETLTELTTGDLVSVVGGASGASCPNVCPQSDFMECLTGLKCLSLLCA